MSTWRSSGKVIHSRFGDLLREQQEAIRNKLNNNVEMNSDDCSVFVQALDAGANPYMHVMMFEGKVIAWGANNDHWLAGMAYTHPNWRRQGIGTLLFQLSKLWWEDNHT